MTEQEHDTGNCECATWARDGRLPLTQHHPSCQHCDLPKEATEIVQALVRGMELWGAEEDGIYPDAWDAYKRGKAFVGQFNWKQEGEC